MTEFLLIPILCAIVAFFSLIAALVLRQEAAEERMTGLDPGGMTPEEYERLNQIRTYRVAPVERPIRTAGRGPG